jgi:hypothetical protein
MRLPFGIALKEATAASKVPAAAAAMSDMAANDESARTRLAEAQEQQKTAADKHRRHEEYAVGEQVMLSTKQLKAYRYKLACRFVGPFTITAVGAAHVTLDLPDDMRLHDVVNVDRIKRYVPSVGEWPGRVQASRPPPASVNKDGEGEWEVEAILGKKDDLEYQIRADGTEDRKKKRERVVRYLVQWVGYDMDSCSWEPAANVAGAADLVNDYERRLLAEDDGRRSVMLLCAACAAA